MKQLDGIADINLRTHWIAIDDQGQLKAEKKRSWFGWFVSILTGRSDELKESINFERVAQKVAKLVKSDKFPQDRRAAGFQQKLKGYLDKHHEQREIYSSALAALDTKPKATRRKKVKKRTSPPTNIGPTKVKGRKTVPPKSKPVEEAVRQKPKRLVLKKVGQPVAKERAPDRLDLIARHMERVRNELKAGLARVPGLKIDVEGLIKGYAEKRLKRLDGKTGATFEAELATLDQQLKGQIHRLLAKKWYQNHRQYQTIDANQGADLNQALGTGICLHNSLAVHVYHLKNPGATDTALEKHLIARHSEKGEVAKNPRARYFSSQDRYFQSQYRWESEETGMATPSSKALAYYGVEQHYQPLMLRKGDNSSADLVGMLNRIVKSGRLKDSGHSFLLGEVGRNGGHAIEVEINYAEGRYSYWEPNYGRFTFPDYETFSREFIGYLDFHAARFDAFDMTYCTLKK